MSIYHQIFVSESYDTPERIESLNKYMYATTQVEELAQIPIPIPIISQKPKSSIIYPDKKDTLFWCLYIANNGVADYEAIRQGYSNIEIAEKQKIMMSIKSQPTKLKSTNVKLTNIAIQEIMSDIVTNATLTVSTMVAMAVFYNKRIILIKGKEFYINVCPLDEYTQTIILIKKDKNDYGIDMDVTNEKIKQIETERICLSKHDRPLEAITNYTVEELKTLAVRLGVVSTVKLTKSGLYQELTIRSLW